MTQTVGSASASVITSTPRRSDSVAPPSSLITSRVGSTIVPRANPAHDLRGRLVTYVLEAAPLEQRRQFLPERLVVAAIRPPVSIPPDAPVAFVARMPGIDRRACPPVGVLVDQPAARTKAIHHLPDRLLLPADEVEQGQTRADHRTSPGRARRAGPPGCRARAPRDWEGRASAGSRCRCRSRRRGR